MKTPGHHPLVGWRPGVFEFYKIIKNKPASPWKQALYQKNTQRTICGGDKRDRTADLLNAIQALSQLSYTPIYVKEAR